MNTETNPARHSFRWRALTGCALAALAGCQMTPPKPDAAQSAPAQAATRSAPAATPAAPVPQAAPIPMPKPQATAPAPAAAAAPPPILPFDEAVLLAANNLFSNVKVEPGAVGRSGGKLPLVIDPLVDGNSGVQSVATETMEERIRSLVNSKYQDKFALQPFSTASLAKAPLLFIGTFTALSNANKPGNDWNRVCLALVDLRTGIIVSKGFARAAKEGVDMTPTAFFLDSPAWAPDPAVNGYIKTCQGPKTGDPVNPAYWDRIMAAAMINDGIKAYNDGHYDEALDLYRGVMRQPGGDQLRVYNGMYLSAAKLGKKDEAADAFTRIVDFGLAQNQLGLKFLFRPGSTLFLADPQISGPYHMWLGKLAERSAQRTACLEIDGHTSRTGPEPLNQRLSLMRAQTIERRIDAAAPALAQRTTAAGKGSSQNISGLGTDDVRDALDRRVEFKVKDCAL